jgi:hypothetical protein
MKWSTHLVIAVASSMAGMSCQLTGPLHAQTPVSFNRDVRPILASRCFVCHGQDEEDRQAGLRLDIRDEAVASGAIASGQPDDSELVYRIFSHDETEVMPPPDSGEPLDQADKELLKRWIREGARYEKHWAFVPPQMPAVPPVPEGSQAGNPIDHFVLRELGKRQLQAAPPADRYKLVRRLYLDLIGLPPGIAEADAFARSADPGAYEKLVDQLLESPRYGERWAQPWLDLARYADTNGYEKDRPRSIWPWRDWVIRALNDDMPFDRFTVEQLAGDMLPDATPEQIIATGFHRNTMLNEEGGIDPLEYRFLAMVDRVATTSLVWMGLTMDCAQCHSHKYDPVSHTDYYRFMALLNNADEPDYSIPDPDKLRARRQVEARICRLEESLASKFPAAEGQGSETERRAANLQREFSDWIAATRTVAADWSIIRPQHMETNLPRLEVLDDGSIFSTGDITKRDVFELIFDLQPGDLPISALRLEALPDDRLPAGGPGRTYYEGRKGDFFVSEVSAAADGVGLAFSGSSHSYGETDGETTPQENRAVFDGDGSTGWQPRDRKGQRLQLVLNLQKPIESAQQLRIKLLFERHYAVSLGRFRVSVTSQANAVANRLPARVEAILAADAESTWSDTERKQVMREFLLTTPLLAEAREELEELKKSLPFMTQTLVMQERPADHPRPAFRHHRGEFLSPREQVTPAIPDLFAAETSADRRPADRLQLARWLASEANPLVARVVVNRAWREFFGAGLVRTNGDFGVQSPPPTHPDLLDWLAVDFMQNGWSMKHLHRRIVTSATYRQDSAASPDLIQRDPQNRWLARGPRFRVSGEMLRDIILKASGLLSDKMYGPGVRPPQPASVTALAYGATPWTPSSGEDRYRRSIYTFRKRTAAFAAYTVFDAPSGESCVVRRNRSNTPLQALTILNDEMYQEMARALARKTIEQKFGTAADSARFIFRRLLTRPPDDSELEALVGYYQTQLSRLEQGELQADLIGGDQQAAPELAAWSMVARVVMNLDETITKP